MLNKIIFILFIVFFVIFSFDFGQRWVLSETAEYCHMIGKRLSDSGVAHCVNN